MVVSNVWGLYPDLEKQSNWINIFRWESTNQMKYIKHIGVCTMSFFVRTGRVHHFNPFSCFHHHDLHSMPSTFVALSREKKKTAGPDHTASVRDNDGNWLWFWHGIRQGDSGWLLEVRLAFLCFSSCFGCFSFTEKNQLKSNQKILSLAGA